jgi:Lar family restriction alleviation protein
VSGEAFVSAPVELKPCPFCGRTDTLDPNDNFGGDRPYAVVCGLEDSQEREACNYVGPEGATKAEAIAKWNTRPLEQP